MEAFIVFKWVTGFYLFFYQSDIQRLDEKPNEHFGISGLSLLENKDNPLEDWRQKFWTSYKVKINEYLAFDWTCV